MYWPKQQSINLNSEVAKLFIQTYYKFFVNLNNRTHQSLSLDILSPSIKQQLLIHTLIEFEVIILDIIEVNLTVQDIKKIYSQIIYNLLSKITKKFVKNLHGTPHKKSLSLDYDYLQAFILENKNLFENLFIFLIFGSEHINKNIFPFNQKKTPRYHVKILFENFILQIGNSVTLNLLEKKNNIEDLHLLFSNNTIYDGRYKSIRDISTFKNNIFTSYWVYSYVYYPHNIYSNQYQIWLFSSKGIIYRYIHANRYYEYLRLSQSQMNAIIYLEIQDFLIPKINLLTLLIGKLIRYIFIEIINKSVQILLNKIIVKVNDKGRGLSP